MIANGGFIMVYAKIKELRVQCGMTQSDLAKKLGVTRSCVNAWEMGISVPSTQYIVQLALLFKVSSDYLLGIDSTSTVNVAGLDSDDLKIVNALISHLRSRH